MYVCSVTRFTIPQLHNNKRKANRQHPYHTYIQHFGFYRNAERTIYIVLPNRQTAGDKFAARFYNHEK